MGGLTDVAGIRVGHWTDVEHATGCTVVVCEDGAVAAVDVRGGAPGSRETDALRPGGIVPRCHAVLLTGGSAYGLAAADGVMRWLEEHGVGFQVGGGVVPIVPAAVILDLSASGRWLRPEHRPGPAAGYAACEAATAGAVPEGTVGAGTGASVAKALGRERAMKGGLGTASVRMPEGITVAALVVVNAVGGVVDPDTGRVLAGPRMDDGSLGDSLHLLSEGGARRRVPGPAENTTIGVVATDAALTKDQAWRLAVGAHDGLAMAVRPSHTQNDGDTFFALATGRASGAALDMVRLGAAAAVAASRAVVRAVEAATSLHGVPSVSEWRRR